MGKKIKAPNTLLIPSPIHPSFLSVAKETCLLYIAESSMSCVDPTASHPQDPFIHHLSTCSAASSISLSSDSTFLSACKCAPEPPTLPTLSSTVVSPPATALLPHSLHSQAFWRNSLYFLKTHSVFNSLSPSYLGNGSRETKQALNCKILCPGSSLLFKFNTANHPLSID